MRCKVQGVSGILLLLANSGCFTTYYNCAADFRVQCEVIDAATGCALGETSVTMLDASLSTYQQRELIHVGITDATGSLDQTFLYKWARKEHSLLPSSSPKAKGEFLLFIQKPGYTGVYLPYDIAALPSEEGIRTIPLGRITLGTNEQ
jgi:hypothetical protein